jgi:hypothetical protein
MLDEARTADVETRGSAASTDHMDLPVGHTAHRRDTEAATRLRPAIPEHYCRKVSNKILCDGKPFPSQ